MKKPRLLPINSRHEGKWVAFDPAYKRVEGYADKLETLKARMGKREVIYRKIPPADKYMTTPHIVTKNSHL